MINANIFEQSMEKAQEVLDVSLSLRAAGIEADYLDRNLFLQNLLGEKGHVTFNPEVSADITEPFIELVREGIRELSTTFDLAPFGDESKIAQFRFYVGTKLREYTSAESLLKNEVPKDVMEYIDYKINDRYESGYVKKEAKKMKSPKLSKLLVKLFGEQHEIVKWYTCNCPKSLTTGVLNDWTVTLSILPHHIAGMSYYSSYNHGGDMWREGYNGTSCMDTKRNSMGSGVFQLVPSMRDTTMAVAYLSYTSDDDIWNPIYQARCLVRVVYIKDVPHMIVCRPYFISNEATHVLVDGLKNKFENVHFVRDMRKYKSGSEFIDITEHLPSGDISLQVDRQQISCPECDGEGNHGYDDDGDLMRCEACDGEGTWNVGGTYLPYIDDGDFISITKNSLVFSIPVDYLKSRGYDLSEKEEEVAEAVEEEVTADFWEIEQHVAAELQEAAANLEERVFAAVGGQAVHNFLVDEDYFAVDTEVQEVGQPPAHNFIVQAEGIPAVVGEMAELGEARRIRDPIGLGAHIHEVMIDNVQFDTEALGRLLGLQGARTGRFPARPVGAVRFLEPMPDMYPEHYVGAAD